MNLCGHTQDENYEPNGHFKIMNFLGQIDYTEGSDISQTIYAMYEGTGQASEVPNMRDEWGADLVQLVGFYRDACGIG